MPEIKDVKDIYYEDVEEKIELLKKKVNKARGNLDRHTIKVEGEIQSMREELVMLGALLEQVPKRNPDLIEPIKDEETIADEEESQEEAV